MNIQSEVMNMLITSCFFAWTLKGYSGILLFGSNCYTLILNYPIVTPVIVRSIERAAEHEAKRTEQKARGELERQKLQNEKEVEETRRTLLELQAVAAAVESSGQAKAEAQAQAEKLLIEGHSAIERM